jgi:hypothetical protein
MKLAERIYPWGQGFNLKSQISNLKSIDRLKQQQPHFFPLKETGFPGVSAPGTKSFFLGYNTNFSDEVKLCA